MYGERPGETARCYQREAITDQIRIVANTVEAGAMHRRLPGINGVIKAGFAAANALRARPRPATIENGNGNSSRSIASGIAEFAPDSKLWSRASVWSRWIARTARRARIVARRRRNYRHLAALLADLPGTRVMRPDLPEQAAPYVFPLWVEAPARIYQRVRQRRYSGLSLGRCLAGHSDDAGDTGSDWAVHVFQLGCHQDLELDDLAVMADTLREILATVEA